MRFTEVTRTAGLDFVHENGKTSKRYLIETMGGGAALADLDGDDALDAFLVNSCPIPFPRDGGPGNAFYHNLGDGTFEDRTPSSGLHGGGYGMGVAAADLDGDGDTDLYVTRYGPNQLFRNDGTGRFTEVGRPAGVADPLWSTSAAFLDADADADGILDLYVCNYLQFEIAHYNAFQREGFTAYANPDMFEGQPDHFFLGRGDGTFANATRPAGLFDVSGKGLGVLAGDLDDDGDTDVYVANDSTPNAFWRNRGDGTFEEVGALLGVAYSVGGASEAGMGVDAGDIDGNLRLDLLTTNFNGEGSSVYLLEKTNSRGGGALYEEASLRLGLARLTLPYLGFGVGLEDFDLDGDLDVFQTNGHVLDNIHRFLEGTRQAQPCQLLENDGRGRYREVTRQACAALAQPFVGRAAAFGDVDGDGDGDVLVLANGGRARLFRNDSVWKEQPIVLTLEGTGSPREPIGARVVLRAGSRSTRRDLLGGRSYLSASQRTLRFAVSPETEPISLAITWPSGQVEHVEAVRGGQHVWIREGEGIVAREILESTRGSPPPREPPAGRLDPRLSGLTDPQPHPGAAPCRALAHSLASRDGVPRALARAPPRRDCHPPCVPEIAPPGTGEREP